MRVLVLPSWYPLNAQDVSGVFFRDQVLAVARTGVEMGVVAPILISMRRIGKWGSASPFENDHGVPTYRTRLPLIPKLPYLNAQTWRLAADRLLKRFVASHGWPDLVHAHSALHAGGVAAEWKKRHGLPYVLTEHRSMFSWGSLAQWQARLARRGIESADALAAVSPELGNLMQRVFPGTSQPWKWIPNVVADRFGTVAQHVRGERIRFSNLALMTENKGQMNLIRAFARAFAGQNAVELVIGGNGPLLGACQALVAELGISSQVRFLGRIRPEAVPKFMAETDVFVLSSYYETFGVVVAEALMSGTPVIATKCGGPEAIVGPEDGVLVPPGDIEAMASAMRMVGGRYEMVDRQAISERAIGRFSAKVVGGQISDMYRDVLATRRRVQCER